MTRLKISAALLGAVLSVGVARADDMSRMDMPKATATAVSRTPADRAYAASMRSMMKGMAVKPTGHPDRDFVDMMIPHHRGAIDMARIELRYGRDPTLRRLARGIVGAQETEIREMRAWRAAHAR